MLYFNDTQTAGPSGEAAASLAGLVKESLRLHYAVTSTRAQNELAEHIGEPPTTRDEGYAMSMWLSAACVQSHAECRRHAARLLSTTSTAARLRRIIKVQSQRVDKKFASRGE